MTTWADFATDEWKLVVQLPRWVVAAASCAQQDLAYRTNHEIEAGFVASANGRQSGNPFVSAVAAETMRVFDDRSVIASIDFGDRRAAVIAVLDRVAAVNQTVKARVGPADAQAYRRWLVDITDVVISAARSGDILGFGGQRVTPLEHSFRELLVLTLQR